MNFRRAAVLAVLPVFVGCGAVDAVTSHVKVDATMTQTNADGTTTTKEFHSTLDQVPAALSKAGDDLQDVTGQLEKFIANATKVPPPGKVVLGDLGLKKYEGNPDYDFLLNAQDADGKAITFQYVQVGVASYDDFFKQVQVMYATLYQGIKTIHAIVKLTQEILTQPVDEGAELYAAVNKALKKPDGDGPKVQQLRIAADLARGLQTLVMQFPQQSQVLVAKGQALITGAPASITNPKVVAHLDLVKKGLSDSVDVVKSAADLIKQQVTDLTNFDQTSS